MYIYIEFLSSQTGLKVDDSINWNSFQILQESGGAACMM